MLDGISKEDPLTDVPKFLAEAGRKNHATELMAAVGDLALIAFYYLLCVGEYTVKGS